MTRNIPTLLILVAAFSALTTFLLVRAFSPDQMLATDSMNGSELTEGEIPRGPNGGRLLEKGNFAVEIVIAEGGIPPEFHLYGYINGVQLTVDDFSASVELGRLGGIRDTFSFIPEGDYLRGIASSANRTRLTSMLLQNMPATRKNGITRVTREGPRFRIE